ncbi:hypothetical protein [Paenibacillus tengchongensis]|uniref:hypothetical protein n=1 Tax=Paenibacillus tengchongensis TaxID=2608684 RepID=UPI00124D31D9|nr:hypothetical protein [Paenibacillus tengchongensis]
MRITETYSPLKFNWSGAFRNTGSQLGTQTISHSSSTGFSLSYVFPTAGKIHFNYRVSSESGFDWFWFNFDGVQQNRISGTQGWFTWEREVSAGSHTLYFGYSTDGSILTGDNGGFITDFWIEYSGIEASNFVVSPNSIHKQDTRISFRLTGQDSTYNQAKYRLYTDAGAQLYPVSGLSSLVNLPYNAEHTFPASLFPVGATTIYLEVADKSGNSVNAKPLSLVLSRTNAAPSADLRLGTPEVHKENTFVSLSVSDPEADSVGFRIYVNGKQKYPENGYADLLKVPFDFTYPVFNRDLITGSNTVKIDLVDDLGATRSYTLPLNKTNQPVRISSAEIRGQTLQARLEDKEDDRIRFQIKVNNVKLYPPEEAWSAYLPSPFDLNYRIPDSSIAYGNLNQVEIVAEDDLGAQSTWQTNTIIDYAGLMFMDEQGLYYSTNLGEVLKYLDTGTVVAGNTSAVYKVMLKNTAGYPLNNITLIPVQRELHPLHELVEISSSELPFDSVPSLNISTLEYGESIPFYVRIHTTSEAIGGGLFDIRATGDPL